MATETIENADRYRIEYSDTVCGMRKVTTGRCSEALCPRTPTPVGKALLTITCVERRRGRPERRKDPALQGLRVHRRRDELAVPRKDSGITAAPLTPAAPQRLAAEPEGHTANLLEWQAPDDTNDDLVAVKKVLRSSCTTSLKFRTMKARLGLRSPSDGPFIHGWRSTARHDTGLPGRCGQRDRRECLV